MKAKHAGILSAILGSICCLGPLLLIALGLGAGAAVIGRYHWLFVAAAIGVLAWAWVKYFREKAVCDCEHTVMQGRRDGMLILLIASMIVLGLAAINVSPYVFAGPPTPAQTQATANGLSRVVIPVEGMNCLTCEIAVRRALGRVPGVKETRVRFASKTAEVDFDARQTTIATLISAINSTGYQASAPQDKK